MKKKTRLNNFKKVFRSSNNVITPHLFFLIMEGYCDEPLWRSWLKRSLKVNFKALTMR